MKRIHMGIVRKVNDICNYGWNTDIYIVKCSCNLIKKDETEQTWIGDIMHLHVRCARANAERIG